MEVAEKKEKPTEGGKDKKAQQGKEKKPQLSKEKAQPSKQPPQGKHSREHCNMSYTEWPISKVSSPC